MAHQIGSDGEREREERNISLLLLCLWMRVHYRDLTFPLHSFQTERLSHFVCATTLSWISQQQLFFSFWLDVVGAGIEKK